MTTTLNKLLIAAVLFCGVMAACDKAQVTPANRFDRSNPVELTQHGNTSCVLVDNKVFCAPAKMRAAIRLAYSTAI